METAKEIFNRYFNQNLTISSHEDFERQVILPAMEAYAQLKASEAFEAARQTNGDANRFADFDAYQSETHAPKAEAQYDHLASMIEELASTVVHQYIPADNAINYFSFSFSTEDGSYEVTYHKDAEGYWTFKNYRLLS